MGEIIANYLFNKGLISGTHEKLKKLKRKTTKNSLKIGKSPEQIILKIRYTNGQQVCKKMCCITNHQANANQSHSEISHPN